MFRRLPRLLCHAGLLLLLYQALPAEAAPLRLLALGDSLTAGYGLTAEQGIVPRLEAALKAKGIDVKVINGGVSGDTTAGGLARLDWALSQGVDAVMVALGANDMLRGLPPKDAERNLDRILERLRARNLPVLLLGMKAQTNLGQDYAREFDAIYPRLAKKRQTDLYPFLLEGVALSRELNQDDGLHPNAKGVEVIVARLLPKVQALLAQVRRTSP